MTRDATLDAFATDDDVEAGGDDADDGDDEEGASGAAAVNEALEPPLPTTDWTPEGAPCDVCGAVVERRWRQDDALVCPECKDWSEG